MNTIIQRQQLEVDRSRLEQSRQDMLLQQEDKGMIAEQLDVSEILNNMYYLLKGYVLTRNLETGQMAWTPPTNNDMVVLSDHGVNYVLGATQWYINKNTLLSNYEDEIINQKMEDFSITLADNIFMDYENMFCFPTIQECKEEIAKRIKNKVDTRVFAKEVLGLKADEKAIKIEVLREMEKRITHELEVIKQQKIKSKLKRFESIIRFVQDAVHSSYNRAWKGQERRTLREHVQINESKGGVGYTPQNSKPQFTLNPLKLMGGSR